ncbi:hypothetical protein BGP77_11035 [Saccharospirillum sp. MSK14-1]|uniref:hypothetical protein n=1 Tax=Saccharospirillum sp. MSK14-1 TaxID=1897632 RepID=UPI000D36C000|nr:hypothetical protein [Saccharospirillum sp. MSK14-1]PTY38706.1 hypothetical protein BGP77_11035 [Saccharospirillum sp. MSK14-1]
MRPNDEQKLEILKVEMSLIQGVFDKYDDLIFRNRNWFITIWAGAIGLAFTVKDPRITYLAVLAAGLYWSLEGMMRHQYWYKYVIRYRSIREWLNNSEEEEISIYDLTNHYGKRAEKWERFHNSFFKLEPTLLGIIMVASALIALKFVPVDG